MFKSFLTYCSKKKRILCPDIYIGKGTTVLLLIITMFFAFAIWWLNHNPLLLNFWENSPIGTDSKAIKIPSSKTETNKLVRQPVSVFSGIVYLIVAIIILKESYNKLKHNSTYNLSKENLIHKMFFALILLYVFVASTFYHASLTNLSLKMDYSAVYFFSLFPVMYFFYRWLFTINRKLLHISTKKITFAVYLVYVSVCLLLSFFVLKGKEHIVTFGCIIIFFAFAIATILANSTKENVNHLILSMVCIMIALVWFLFGEHTDQRNLHNYFQPHSLWNLFIGLSGFYFYVFIRSEHLGNSGTEVKLR